VYFKIKAEKRNNTKAKYMEEEEPRTEKNQNPKPNKLNFYLASCQTHKVLPAKH